MRIESEFGLPAGSLARAAFSPRLLREATTGAISDAVWRERVAETLVAAHGDAARGAVVAWTDLGSRLEALEDRMLELVRQVRTAVPVVLVTNATTRLRRDLDALGLRDAFDAIANSSELGVVKPDREIFQRAAALVGVPLQECVVIDDQPGHLEAARAAGAAVIHHTSVAATRDALMSHGPPHIDVQA